MGQVPPFSRQMAQVKQRLALIVVSITTIGTDVGLFLVKFIAWINRASSWCV